MMMSMMSMMAYLSSNALATGRDPVPTGNDHPIASPYGLFRTADGDIAVAPSTDGRSCAAFFGNSGSRICLSRPEVRRPTRCGSENRAELNALIDAALAHGTQADWIERLNRPACPAAASSRLTEALADPQVAAQDMVLRRPAPGHGVWR
jgi:CoA:oxalate CoA-transferase